MDKAKRILVVKLSSMGDIVHSLPIASALKSKFPDAFIGWAVEDGFKDLLAAVPFIDGVYVLKTRQWRKDFRYRILKEISSAIRDIRNTNFDIAIDAQGLLKSGVITFLSGAPVRFGFSSCQAREPMSAIFVNRKITPQGDITHIIDQNLYLLRDIVGDIESPYPKLYVSESDDAWVLKEMNEMGIAAGDMKVLISPGAGWETKLWNPKKYREIIIELNKRFQARVILSGSFADKELIEEISSDIPFSVPRFIGDDITQMMALLKNVDLVIGGDTGPIHVASALGTPTLSLYGPSAAKRSGPRGEYHESIQSDIPCSPCFARKCKLSNSQGSFSIASCMEAISIESVKVKLENILNRIASFAT